MEGIMEKQFPGLGWGTFWFNRLFCQSTEQTLPTGSQCIKADATIRPLDEGMRSCRRGCLYRCFLNRSCVKNQKAIHQQQVISLVSGGGGLNKEGRRFSCEIRQDCPQHTSGSKELQKGEDGGEGTPSFVCDVSLYCLNFSLGTSPWSRRNFFSAKQLLPEWWFLSQGHWHRLQWVWAVSAGPEQWRCWHQTLGHSAPCWGLLQSENLTNKEEYTDKNFFLAVKILI